MNKFYMFLVVISIVDVMIVLLIHEATLDIGCPNPTYVYDIQDYRRYYQSCVMSQRQILMIPLCLVANFILMLIFKAGGME